MLAKDSGVLREYTGQEGKGHVGNTQPGFFYILCGCGRGASEIQKYSRQDSNSKQGRFGSDIYSHITSSEFTEARRAIVTKTELTTYSTYNPSSPEREHCYKHVFASLCRRD